MNTDIAIFIGEHLHDDVQQLALQRNRFPQLSDTDFRFLLQQIEGRQRTKDKLPSFAQNPDWWYPVRLSCEQCSSEATARYKAEIIKPFLGQADATLIDLTAGYGVDTFFMSEHTKRAHYVERNSELCAIAQHNFALSRPHIQVHNITAEEFLSSLPISNTPYPLSNTLIYLDPARRSQSGGKVFRIEDCEPNVIEILPILRKCASAILIKFSPMLDISAAMQSLGSEWDIHVVALHNEVKEVLFITGNSTIHAVNISHNQTTRFTLTQAEEKATQNHIANTIGKYLYKPNAAIIKAGAFRLVGERYGIAKLDTNTHLYTSDTLLPDFQGRVWKVIDTHLTKPSTLDPKLKYSIISRNYPLSPEQMRKKYKLQDGNDYYLIGARHQGKPTLMLCLREY
ncbi:MAG: SAM-dependent methyltransferase [Paludibacteraceae bacterium]|nr:SAM-dependent methyltransferase [Paludibacteraceae bacterium]MBP3576018.1 SAM-dependent methyltransferase [Paludibacteraceae bacterium]